VSAAAKAAAEAHTNLNIFAAVVSLMDGGHVYGPSADSAAQTARKIVQLCKAEQRKQLLIYDKNIAAVKKGTK